MRRHQIEVDCDWRGHGRIVIGGNDVANYVRGFTFYAEAGEVPSMHLRLKGGDDALRVMGEVVVEMPDDFRAFLIDAGWTPPAEVSG